MSEFEFSGIAFTLVLIIGISLYWLLRRLRTFLYDLPLTKKRRALFIKLRPVAEVVVLTGFVVLAIRLIFRGETTYSAVALALFAFGALGLSWFAIRDMLAGFFIKASEVCLPGDFVEIDGISGWVRGLGYRNIALETPDGSQAFVPYSRVSRQSLVRAPATDGIHRHTFNAPVPEGVEMYEARQAIRRCALNSHWSSVVREPAIEPDHDGGFSVTVFTLAPNLGILIEHSVKSALARAGEAGVERESLR